MTRVQDSFKVEHGKLVRKRYYADREKVLRENAEMQKAETVRPMDGLRPFARFPESELERLAEAGRTRRDVPSWYADLDSPDSKVSSAAKVRLVNSSEGKQYRVGQPKRKTFAMPKYKFVGNGKYEAL